MEFLQGLHDRFSAIRSQILLMEPFPTATKIYSLVRQEEKQQEIQSLSSPMPDAAVLNAAKVENRTAEQLVINYMVSLLNKLNHLLIKPINPYLFLSQMKHPW
ncbi:hypothetical protein EZV62_006422 [Acer yangbiense]|uniref:Uncharacterized protein n=1 Tax=Acer yangbiense TaxID=1000413 RepID=A0A5C7I7M3_9ROSI|nr:hypothetical protein EZV62_006422 [Acer yangbiense]